MRPVLSIKNKMILGGIAAVLIPLVITGFIIYFQLSRSLLDIKKQESVHFAEEISEGIGLLLKQELDLASSIAADPDVVAAAQTGDFRETQIELEAIHQRLDKASFTLFVTNREGVVKADAFFSQQIGLNISSRDYFKQAQKGIATFSGPFFAKGSATPGKAVVVGCSPIMEDHHFLGVVALAVDTDYLNAFLEQKKSGQSGYAFLINNDGLILVHPRKDYILKYHLLDLPGTGSIRDLLAGHRAGATEYKIEGVDKIIGLAQGKQMDWVAAFVQDRDEVLKPLRSILWSICASAAVFLFLTMLIIVVFSKKISLPIHRSLEMIKQMTRYSNEIIIQAGPDGKIVFVNPAFEKVTGLASQDVIGLTLDINATLRVSLNTIWESLQKGVPWSGRVSIRNAKTRDVTMDVTILPLRDDRGAIQGYLEIGRDVTSEIIFEKGLQQAQKMEALGKLAGGIAHDFNNILTGIFGFAEVCLIKKDSPDEVEDYVREIIIASERARNLVSQILTFSRKSDVEMQPLVPKTVLNEALKLLKVTTPPQIDIQTKIESDCTIIADPTKLHQVVMNLVTNGVHAIGENTGIIKLELEDFMVDDAFTQTHPNISPGKHVILRIIDSGCGMDPETLEHVFEPFFTTKTGGKGTGLGLAMVHGIVNQLGGIITAYSRLGQGSTFNIILPCAQADQSCIEPPATYIREGTERILVADDEKTITATMETILTSLGYRVTVFTDSRLALAALLAKPGDFDILLTDYAMPHLNGLDLVREIKTAGIDLPVILASGFLGKTFEEEARNLGVSTIIPKPITTYQLTNAIQKAVNRS